MLLWFQAEITGWGGAEDFQRMQMSTRWEFQMLVLHPGHTAGLSIFESLSGCPLVLFGTYCL